MSVRTKLLAAFHNAPNNQVLYTCPASKTAIVKWYSFANQAATPVTFGINFVHGATVTTVYGTDNVPSSTTRNAGTYWVLVPGDQLKLITAAGGVMDVNLFGVELAGVAP